MKNTLKIVLLNFVFLIFFGVIFTVVGEIYLRINPDYLIKNIVKLPKTSVRESILFSNKQKSLKQSKDNSNKIKKFIFSDFEINLPMSSIFFPLKEIDILYGGEQYMFYNNGFCNNHNYTGEKTIIAVGDSFTYCTVIEPLDSWVNNLYPNQNLNETYNFGLSGVGPYEYNNILKNVLSDKTKLILYGYYEGNDLRDILRYQKKKNKISKNKEEKESRLDNKLKHLLLSVFGDSYFFNFNWVILKKILKKNHDIDFRYIIKNKNILFNPDNTDLDEAHIAKKLFESNAKYVSILDKGIYKNFKEANNISNSNGSKIVFIYFPSAYSVFGKELVFKDKSMFPIMKNYSKTNLDLFFKNCQKLNLNCLNLIPDLSKQNLKKQITHFPAILHLTPKGHEVVAEAIKNYTCQNFKFEDFFKNLC